jgi:large subunit ribosomal protein L20
MHGLKLANVDLDRKSLADIAVRDEAGFAILAEQAKTAIASVKK